MSGGHFDYLQRRLEYEVIDEIKEIIDKNKKEIPDKKINDWCNKDYYEKYPEEKLYSNYSNETINKFKEGVDVIRKAYVYIKRIDWLLSGDDGEDNFHKRLENDLNKLNTNGSI